MDKRIQPRFKSPRLLLIRDIIRAIDVTKFATREKIVAALEHVDRDAVLEWIEKMIAENLIEDKPRCLAIKDKHWCQEFRSLESVLPPANPTTTYKADLEEAL